MIKKNITKRFLLFFIASVLLYSSTPIPIAYATDVSVKGWKVNLPSKKGGGNGSGKGCSQEIKQPELDQFLSNGGNDWFKKLPDGSLSFHVDTDISSCTTGGSDNTRSELREMTADGSKEYEWMPNSGTHRMLIRQKVTEMTSDALVVGQTHDLGDIDDFTVWRIEGGKLGITKDGDIIKDFPFELNKEFTVGFSVENGTVKYYFDPNGGSQPPEVFSQPYPGGSEGVYFKAGNYCQCGTIKSGDGGKTTVIISGLGVTHDGSMPNIGEGGGNTGSTGDGTSCDPDSYDSSFFGTNDILYYSPCGTPGICQADSSPLNSVIEGNDNEEKIYNFLTSTPISTNNNKPMNPIQASAMIGNFWQESQLDPETGSQSGSGPYGLVQWIRDRKTKLLQKSGPETLETQLRFIVQELEGDEKAIMSHVDFKNASDIEKATLAVRKIYERPNEAEAMDEKRIAQAQATLEKFGDTTPSSLETVPGSGTNDTNNAQCVGGGNSKFVTDDGFIVYNQEDSAWASQKYGDTTIKAAGCGPSAMAAIITALTGKQVTPAETGKYADENNMYVTGVGSKHTLPPVLAPNWGLTARKIGKTANEINTALRDGGLVIISGTGAAPFTAAGHYIVIRGVTDTGKWKIADSNGTIGQKNSTQEWDPDPILLNAAGSSIYAVTK